MKQVLISIASGLVLTIATFGQSFGGYQLMDVHGAGAQRSDPKVGSASDFPHGFGPQGDVRRIDNFVRMVREHSSPSDSYAIVDTLQTTFYGNTAKLSQPPTAQDAFYGQDAQFQGLAPRYQVHSDGTVTDENTGLMWQTDPGTKLTWEQAQSKAASARTGGYADWRLPTVKELYSLIEFVGQDPNPQAASSLGLRPFIDTSIFHFRYGNPADGERVIDSQFLSSTRYVSTTMNGNRTVFGVNFADGRIKGYPIDPIGPHGPKTFEVLLVRGNPQYGKNRFVDQGDGTVLDKATGLIWQKSDSGKGMNWEQALAWVAQKNREHYLGHSDWRLPDAKELQSIVDYGRSPDTTHSPALDPVFDATAITNEGGQRDWGFYWTGTTHLAQNGGAREAVYVAFGRALGYMRTPGERQLNTRKPQWNTHPIY